MQLLGDELIADDRLAIFELVKNGYDADATHVKIVVDVASATHQSISVEDNGTGMTQSDITGKWLELATDSRRRDRAARSRRFGRLALGEKGIGRFASLKLGKHTRLITKAVGHPECRVEIDWDKLIGQGPYLSDLEVTVEANPTPSHFVGDATGTLVEIAGLRRADWTRAELRRLYRLVTSLASPFQTPDQFTVTLSAPGRDDEVADLIAPNAFLDFAVWQFTFEITGRRFSWVYEFRPPHWKGVSARSETNADDRLILVPFGRDAKASADESHDRLLLDADGLEGIGPIKGSLFGFYRRAEVLGASGNSSQLKSWLDDQTGVRVYRDGVRVFNYGEGSDDWLELNVRRINAPGGKLGTNSVVAAIHLSLADSRGLKETANREGFDQNSTFRRFRQVVQSAFERFEQLHAVDRQALDTALRGADASAPPLRFTEAVKNLRSGLKKHHIEAELAREINAIELDFVELRDVMTNAGIAGLNLAVVFHEVEREVESLATAVDRGADPAKVRQQIGHLHQLLQGFAPLLRKSPSRLVFVGQIVKATTALRQSRFRFHNVELDVPILSQAEADFKVRGASNLLIGALGNLLDNALYWARVRKEKDERPEPAAVAIRCKWDADARTGMIAVVDNGPGFTIPESRAVAAFASTRPGGMGLGLYFANLVMEQSGGQLTIQAASQLRDDIDLPANLDGAAVIMRFGATP